MKFGKRTWMVEYDWMDTPHGKRPEWIRMFHTECEAREFAKTKPDGHVTYMDEILD